MKIAVLGGGITGLCAAYFSQKKGNEVTLFEKNACIGGWLDTTFEGGFFFEKGPRTFKTSRCLDLLQLIFDGIYLARQLVSLLGQFLYLPHHPDQKAEADHGRDCSNCGCKEHHGFQRGQCEHLALLGFMWY